MFSSQISPSVCGINGSTPCLPRPPTSNHGTYCTTTAFDGTKWIYTISAVCSNVSNSRGSTTHVTNVGRRTMPSASSASTANAPCCIVWHGRWPDGRNINGTLICTTINNIGCNYSSKVRSLVKQLLDCNQYFKIIFRTL